MKYPQVTVQVINFNGGEKIIRGLNKVFEMNFPLFEVIVIDNGSTDGSKEKIKKMFPQILLVENKKNLGSVLAHNQGFKLARGEFILSLDDDAVVSRDLLTSLLKIIEKDKLIGIIVPKLYYFKRPTTFNSTGFFLDPFFGKTKDLGIGKQDCGQLDFQREVDYVPSAVILLRKEVINNVGGMNEDYFVYYEDVDWCKRIRDAGYKIIYTPTAKAWHDCKTPSELSKFRVYHYSRGKTFFMIRNFSIIHNVIFSFFLFTLYSPFRVMLFLFKRKPSLIKSYLLGIYDGFTGKKRIELP